MNYKIKLGILSLLIFVKVTFLWNVGFSYAVAVPLAVIVFFMILIFIFNILNFLLDYPAELKKRGAYNAPTSPEIVPIDQSKVKKDLEMLRRRDLSQFFQMIIVSFILINFLDYIFYLPPALTWDRIMTNGILSSVSWIVVDMVNYLHKRLIYKIRQRMLQKAQKSV